MESRIATGADAELIMKLYDLRREPVLRKARHWVAFDFNPKTKDEFLAVRQDFGSEHNAWLRQVITYWEMAASFVNHGAVNPDMYLDSNGEGIFIYAKFHEIMQSPEATTGPKFMQQTATLIEKFPGARERFQASLKGMQARKA
ncbi:MAG TPA: hypothetical protein VHX63_09110 [Acidobacteriaceae bacterium]|jgi:hypothetical protein|nr:hypothetical protein [Acidobacteriaceae bacterium]